MAPQLPPQILQALAQGGGPAPAGPGAAPMPPQPLGMGGPQPPAPGPLGMQVDPAGLVDHALQTLGQLRDMLAPPGPNSPLTGFAEHGQPIPLGMGQDPYAGGGAQPQPQAPAGPLGY